MLFFLFNFIINKNTKCFFSIILKAQIKQTTFRNPRTRGVYCDYCFLNYINLFARMNAAIYFMKTTGHFQEKLKLTLKFHGAWFSAIHVRMPTSFLIKYRIKGYRCKSNVPLKKMRFKKNKVYSPLNIVWVRSRAGFNGTGSSEE